MNLIMLNIPMLNFEGTYKINTEYQFKLIF